MSAKKTDEKKEVLKMLDGLEEAIKLLRVALKGGTITVDKASTRTNKAKVKERPTKQKAKKQKMHKRTPAIVKKLESWGYEIVQDVKTTWKVLNKDGAKVGVVKPMLVWDSFHSDRQGVLERSNSNG